MRNYLVLGLIVLSAAACTSTPAGDAATAEAGVICKKETSIGSYVPKKHCTTAAEREKAKKQAEDFLSAPTQDTHRNE